MNAADLWDKIRDRATSDTGAGGLFKAGSELINAFYYAAIPESVDMPYCVFNISADTGMSAFDLEVSEVRFRIATYVARTSATITDPANRGSQILARLYGNGYSASPPIPTYGFHRFKPTLATWTAAEIIYVQTLEEHSDDYYCWVMEFKVIISL